MIYGEMVFIICKLIVDGQNYFVVVNLIEFYYWRKNEFNMRMVVKVIYILMIILENVEWFDGYFEERGKVMGLLGFLEIFIFWLCLDNIDCMDEGMYKCVICDELVFGNEVE